MADSRYTILVKAVIDPAQLQTQLNQTLASKPVTIKANAQLDQHSIDNQIQLWNNAIAKMTARQPAVMASPEVQKEVVAFNQLVAGFKNGVVPIKDVRVGLDNVRTSATQVASSMRDVTHDGMTMNQMFELAVKKVLIWAGATMAIYGTLRQIGEGVQYIKDLNKELTSIAEVTGMSTIQIAALAQQYNDLAIALGSTTLEVAKGSLEWFRQGKTVEETGQLMKSVTMMSKLGNLEAAQATELMTSTLNGFKLSAEESARIVDKLVGLDNAYATSVAEISTALQYGAAVANQAGVSFDQLAAYIAVVSSVTRISAETIGQSFKTMLTRMEQIKIGKLFEDDPTTINQVAEALDNVGIALMKDADTFRPMGDVLDELAGKWSGLTQKQQNAIAGTIAGIRQVPQFLTLMQNWTQVTKALGIEQDSTGLATQRFGIYLDSLEAKSNKFTATWQRLASSTINSEFVKRLIDLGTTILNLVDKVGILNIAIVALSIVMATKWGLTIPKIVGMIATLITSIGAETVAVEGLTIAWTTLSTVMGGLLIGGAIILLASILNNTANSAQKTREKIVALESEISSLSSNVASSESQISSLTVLGFEYENLRGKVKLSSDEQKRFSDVQNQIKSILPEVNGYYDDQGNFVLDLATNLKTLIDLKQQEIDLDNKKIQGKLIEQLNEESKAYQDEARYLADLNKQKKIYAGESGEGGGLGETIVNFFNPDKLKEVEKESSNLSDQMKSDILGIKQAFLKLDSEHKKSFIDALKAEGKAGETLLEILYEISNTPIESNLFDFKKFVHNLSSMGDQVSTTAEEIKSKFSDIETIIQDSLGKAMGDYEKQISSLQDKLNELQDAIEIVSQQPVTTDQQQKLGDLQYQADQTKIAMYDLANSYVEQTRIAIINLAIQRIELATLSPAARAAGLQMVTDLAVSWGLMTNETAAGLMIVDQAVSILATDTATSVAQASGLIAQLQNQLLSIQGNYYVNVIVNTIQSGTYAPGLQGQNMPPEPKPRSGYPGYNPGGAAGGGGGGGTKKQEEQISAAKLLSQIVDLIKEQKKAEIDLLKAKQDANKLEQDRLKDQQKALDDQLDKYKDIIDARKDIIRSEEEELSYQEEIADKNKSIAQIENELAILKLDTSEESKARQLELQADLVKQKDDLEKTQRQHSVDEQEKALDKEYSLYEININKQKENIQSQIDLLDKANEAIDKQIDVINDYLSKSGLIAQDAIKMMIAKAPELYDKLVEYNKVYGTGIEQDITRAWNEAYKALKKYKDIADALYGESDFSSPKPKPKPKPEGHHTGLESGPAGGYETPIGTVFSELMMGERILNEKDMLGIMQVRIPKIAKAMGNGGGDLIIDNLININGNVDKEVIPDIDRIANQVVGKINGMLLKRGYTRGAQVFST